MIGVAPIRRILKRTIARQALVSWRHRGLTPSDCMLASYPKSGNTWVKFVLATLLAKSSTDVWSDENSLVPTVGHHQSALATLPQQGRLIKTHEPFRNVYTRAIWLVRDPRDVLISYYHHEMRVRAQQLEFADFLKSFVQGHIDGYGTWEYHTRTWLDAVRKGQLDILPVRYEDLLADPQAGYENISRFLRLELPATSIASAIADNTPDRMREKERTSAKPPAGSNEKQSFVRAAKARNWDELLAGPALALFEQQMAWSLRFLDATRPGFDFQAALADSGS